MAYDTVVRVRQTHAMTVYKPEGSPLPKATSKHDHYEAVTRADTLMMELLRLWSVEQQPPRELHLVYDERYRTRTCLSRRKRPH